MSLRIVIIQTKNIEHYRFLSFLYNREIVKNTNIINIPTIQIKLISY